jgi:hypothetical protein
MRKLWSWWMVRIRGYNWCEYQCGCLATSLSMHPKCPMCDTKIKKLHKEKHEIQIQIENWEGI